MNNKKRIHQTCFEKGQRGHGQTNSILFEL